jgi:carboxypeptidase Q
MAIIFDEGSGPATGFSLGGRNDLRPAIQPLLAPYAQWGVTMLTDDAPVGTDNFDFLLEGVPNLIANQQEANYIVNYHASSDTFDKVDLPQLKKHVALAAGVAAAIADAPERPAPRQARAQIQALMGPTHLDEQMKIFGMWDDWQTGKRGRKD